LIKTSKNLKIKNLVSDWSASQAEGGRGSDRKSGLRFGLLTTDNL
jgi:hypothetical protein